MKMPYSGPEHAAELLRGADTAQHAGAVALGPQVGAQRQRHRQQRTAGDPWMVRPTTSIVEIGATAP